MVETPRATRRVQRPRVLGIVIVLVLRGLTSLFFWDVGKPLTSRIPELFQDSGLLSFSLLASAIVYLLAAILIQLYRRMGLYLCLLLFVFEVLTLIVSILLFRTALTTVDLPQLAIGLYLGYYAYRYLTQEPEKDFFR
jgi:hypothetical protein